MRAIRTVLTLGVLAVLLSTGAAFAANSGIVKVDHIKGAIGHDSLASGTNLRFVIRYTNNIGVKCDVSNGYRISSPDGAVWDSSKIDSCGPFVSNKSQLKAIFSTACVWRNYFTGSPTGQPDTMSFLGVGNDPADPSQQLPAGFDDTVLAINVWMSTDSSLNAGKHICIDSSAYRPSNTWKWPDADLVDHVPEILGTDNGPAHTDGSGYCYLLFNTSPQGVTDRGGSLPKSFSVSQNYPNPFNPTTKIDFEVPVKSDVKLSVYNVLGQKVVTLVDKAMNPGKYVADWDGRSDGGTSVASGIYFYKFEAGSYVMTKKMIMLK
jgi:hypothetical protein